MIKRLLINTFLLFNSYYSVVMPLPINKYKPIRNSSLLSLIHNNNNTCRDLFNHNRNSKISIMLRKNNDYNNDNIDIMNLLNLINFYICIIKVLKFINLF
jgi:hypothetical protein